MCRTSSNTRSGSGPGGAGESREKRSTCAQQPPGEQRDAAGGWTLPDVSRALRQAAAGQASSNVVLSQSLPDVDTLTRGWPVSPLAVEWSELGLCVMIITGFNGLLSNSSFTLLPHRSCGFGNC